MTFCQQNYWFAVWSCCAVLKLLLWSAHSSGSDFPFFAHRYGSRPEKTLVQTSTFSFHLSITTYALLYIQGCITHCMLSNVQTANHLHGSSPLYHSITTILLYGFTLKAPLPLNPSTTLSSPYPPRPVSAGLQPAKRNAHCKPRSAGKKGTEIEGGELVRGSIQQNRRLLCDQMNSRPDVRFLSPKRQVKGTTRVI